MLTFLTLLCLAGFLISFGYFLYALRRDVAELRGAKSPVLAPQPPKPQEPSAAPQALHSVEDYRRAVERYKLEPRLKSAFRRVGDDLTPPASTHG